MVVEHINVNDGETEEIEDFTEEEKRVVQNAQESDVGVYDKIDELQEKTMLMGEDISLRLCWSAGAGRAGRAGKEPVKEPDYTLRRVQEYSRRGAPAVAPAVPVVAVDESGITQKDIDYVNGVLEQLDSLQLTVNKM